MGTHVYGFEPPVSDGIQAELHRFLVAQAPEPLAVNVALVHEHIALAVVASDEAWRDVKRDKVSDGCINRN